jgi:RNA polymerase sigma-70 factor (ECF subfamily)
MNAALTSERVETVTTATDDDLVERSRRGDRAAFEQLVRRTARVVYARQYLETRDAHRAEDLTQETFLLAWRSVGKLADSSGFRVWLLTIARSVATDAYRRETRRKRDGGKRAEFAETAEQVADGAPTPDETMEIDERRRRVAGALNALPEEYSLPLTLRYVVGADYDTIGRQLGLSNGSLRGLLSRGMAKLREKLKNER